MNACLKSTSFVRCAVALLICAFGMLLLGCSGSEESSPISQPVTGSLFVRVYDAQHQVISGALVQTDPRTVRATTDDLGTCMLEGLAAATYTIIATFAGYGTGSTAATVSANSVTNVEISLIPGIFLEPRPEIHHPGNGQVFSYVDTVLFYGTVTAFEDSGADLEVEWRSSRDGTLFDTTLSMTSDVSFSTHSLSLGEHLITLFAINPDSLCGVDTVRVAIQSFSPEVTILAPTDFSEFTPGEPIEFRAQISDRETRPQDLTVVWRSDRDGQISTASPNENGESAFSISSLSRGSHWISVHVSDPDANSSSDSVLIHNVLPSPVTLNPPVADQGRVELSWSRSEEPDFEVYEVYRSESPGLGRSGSLIAILDDANIVSMTDSTPPYVEAVYYQVFVGNTSGYYAGSNEEQVDYPAGTIFNISPTDIMLHPQNSWIYLYDNGGLIIIYDWVNMQEVNRTTLDGSIGWVDIADDGAGAELYIPMQTEGWIRIYDAENLTQTAILNTGDMCECAVADGNGHIYADVRPSPWWNWPVRSYDRATLSPVDSAGGGSHTVFGGRLRMSRGTGELIEISTWVSPVDADYFQVDASGYFISESDDPYHGDHPLYYSPFRMSPNGDFWICSMEGAVYRLSSAMTFEGTLPTFSANFTDFAFSTDGQTIYAGLDSRAGIRVYSYPSLADQGEISTRGIPRFLMSRGNELIAVIEVSSSQVAVEVVPIP